MGSPRRSVATIIRSPLVELDLELGQEGGVVPVLLGPVLGDLAGVPAAPEARRDDVLAGRQEVTDIGRRVLDPRPVVGPARRHPVRADEPTVDAELDQAERGHVGARASGRPGQPDGPAKDRRPGRPARQRGIDPSDPARNPVAWVEETHLPGRGRAPRPRPTAIVRDPDPPEPPLAGGDGRTVVGGRRLRAGDLGARPEDGRRGEGRVRRDLDRDRRLLDGRGGKQDPPAQPWPRLIDADRVDLPRRSGGRWRWAASITASNDPPPRPEDRAAEGASLLTLDDLSRSSRALATARLRRAGTGAGRPGRRGTSAGRRHRW